ncbi:MAG: DNA primase, partial [Nitrosopumilus sp.]
MQESDIQFLENSFKKYYFDHFDQIKVPERTSEREFGYQKFNSGMTRHIAIKDDKELHLMLIQNIPSDVYCSNAYYTFPNLPMNEKDWKEADLIFDID